jgi:heme O synthase-like polyprenyltransferase
VAAATPEQDSAMNQIATDANQEAAPATLFADWRDYFALLKPRVMTLVIFTAACAMAVAPGSLHPMLAFTGILCIAVAAGAAGALNQWYEADIDALLCVVQYMSFHFSGIPEHGACRIKTPLNRA